MDYPDYIILLDNPKVMGDSEKNKTPIKRVFLDPNFGTITRPANWDAINWITEKNIKKNPIVVFEKSIFSIIQGKWETVFPQINAGVNNDKQAE